MVSSIFVIFILWFCLVIYKLFKKKPSNNKETLLSLFDRMKTLKFSQKLFIICVAFFDVLVIILSIQGYHFLFLKSTGFIIPIALTYVAFCVLANGLNLEKFWIILTTVVVLPVLGLMCFFNIVENNSYSTIDSPSKEKMIIIEHREAALGETNHFYNFYRRTAVPLVVKKLNSETVRIVTRGSSAGNLEVLGINNANWVDGQYVTFHSPFAETIVQLRK